MAIGKIDNQEVDFIGAKADEKKYIQVTESMNFDLIQEGYGKLNLRQAFEALRV